MSRDAIPRATYRVQLNRDFTFNDAAAIVPYLARLGISHLYTSPILKARPGSMHGYDVVDHTVLNPELGTPEDFERLSAALSEHQMALLVDVVPNHLGIMGCDNEWWLDVLENGPSAENAPNFDIDWRPNRASLRNRVLVPILGAPYGTVLERGELKVQFDAERGSFKVRYYDHCFPIDPREYPKLFVHMFADDDPPSTDPDRADFESLMTAFGNLPPRDDDASDARLVRYRDKEAHKRRLVRLIERSPLIREHIDAAIDALNGTAGQPDSFDALDRVLDAQAYRVAYWRVSSDEINYRRFFDVNDLAALRMNERKVFDQTHELVLRFVQEGKIHGLRIDHSDGLFDPMQYFARLQERFEAIDAAPGVYLVTEKILATHERLPKEWPIHGTTGYDFVALANGWLVYAEHEEALTRIYRQFTGVSETFEELAYHAKRLVMRTSLAAEIEVLATQLDRIAQLDRHTADFTRASMREAIVETIARFPVYRTYVSERGISAEDRRIVQRAINVARVNSGDAEVSIYDFLRDVLLGDMSRGGSHAQTILEFAMKFQQVTAPVTAKGVEDTAFYRYYRLLSVNEVGGDPGRIAFSSAAVHQENLERVKNWPHSMLATSTHDTKRSEDARARIAVLSELTEEWRHHLARWGRLNRGKRRQLEKGYAPTRNDEYLIYQTLLGIWSPHDSLESLCQRMQAYLVKASREAKRMTSWLNPDEEYEGAIQEFVARLLESGEQNTFLHNFIPFAERVAFFGHLNSLAQTVLKHTSPGVPDTYQGTEAMTLALVDPDNRRPVDFAANAAALRDVENGAAFANALASAHETKAKIWLTAKLLQIRGEMSDVFAHGDYEPLHVSGALKDHILAFARTHERSRVIVVIAKWFARLTQGELRVPLGDVWVDTTVALPQKGIVNARDVITQAPLEAITDHSLQLSALFERAPFAVIVGETE